MCHYGQVYSQVRYYGVRGGGYPNILSSVLRKSREWPWKTVRGSKFQTPTPPSVASPLRRPTDKIQNKSMNFIYKNFFAMPNLRPHTKHKKRIIPVIITGRISSFFLLLYYTPNSLCFLDGGPPYKNVVSKVGGSSRKLGGPDPRPPSGCALV